MEELPEYTSLQRSARPKTLAVNDISLELTPGVWPAGADGAGKTTLTGPASGRVLYDSVPIQELGEQFRSIFGFHLEFTVKGYMACMAALNGFPERVSLMDVYKKKTFSIFQTSPKLAAGKVWSCTILAEAVPEYESKL